MSEQTDQSGRGVPGGGFAAALTDLADAGSAAARPFPAASVHARGRARQKRQRFTVAASGVAACAVAAGVVALGHGGPAGAGRLNPTGPVPTGHGADISRYLQAAELPNYAAYAWKQSGSLTHETTVLGYEFPLCGSGGANGPSTSTAATSADVLRYSSTATSLLATESIFHFASADAARAAYKEIDPTEQACGVSWSAGHQKVLTFGGWEPDAGWPDSARFVWQQTVVPQDKPHYPAVVQHAAVAVAGSDLAYFAFQEPASSSRWTDPSGNQELVLGISARLNGSAPEPLPQPQYPAKTSAGSQDHTVSDTVWLKDTEFPYASADQSHGWFVMESHQTGPGGPATSDLCTQPDTGSYLDSTGATVVSQMLHGTPSTVPLDPKTGYLYSSANQNVVVYSDNAAAQAAFAKAVNLLKARTCHVKSDSFTGDRTITVGAHGVAAFSAAIDDAGSGHTHEYLVLKGKDVVEVNVNFVSGGTNTDFSGDQAFLDLIASKLP